MFNKCGSTGATDVAKTMKWFKKRPKVKEMFNKGGIDWLLSEKFESFFHRPIEEWRDIKMSGGDANNFEKEIRKMTKTIESGKFNGKFAETFWATSSIVKKFPILEKTLGDYININHVNKGQTVKSDNSYNRFLNELKGEAITNGVYNINNERDWKSAVKEANSIMSEFEQRAQRVVDGKENITKVNDVFTRQERFLMEGEGKIMYDFVGIIEKELPRIEKEIMASDFITEKQKQTERLGYKISKPVMDNVKKAIRTLEYGEGKDRKQISPRMQNAVYEYVNMMSSGYEVARKGVDAFIKSIEYGILSKGFKAKGDMNAKLKELRSELKQKFLPKQMIGYFPRYGFEQHLSFLDSLMPKLEQLSISTRESLEKGSFSINEAISEVKTALTGRLKPRRELDPNDLSYSRNVVAATKRYLDEINRFNFNAHVTRDTRKALYTAKGLFKEGKDLGGFGTTITKMILDMHADQTGLREAMNPELEAASRFLLNLEFTSKIGLNFRSPVKQVNQFFLEQIDMGWTAERESAKFYASNPDFKRRVARMGEEAGFGFEKYSKEIEEIGTQGFGRHKVVKDATGYTLEFNAPGKLSWLAEGMQWVSGKTGFMMNSSENWLRNHTFKVGFFKMYSDLKYSPEFERIFVENYKLKHGSNPTAEVIENERFKRARNYGINSVIGIHFDYSKVSKAKALKHPFGRFMFQFQHVAHKMAEKNFDYLSKAVGDAKAGEWGGANMKRMYAIGLVYSLVPAVTSYALGVDFSRIIQNDTQDRLEQLYTLMTGDMDEIDDMFKGRGALSSVMSFPLFGDMLAIGELVNLYKLDEDSMARKIFAYRDYADMTGEEKFYSAARILNTSVGRGLSSTWPLAMKGSPFTALQHEVGLYPTKEVKETRKSINDAVGYISPELESSLDKLMNIDQLDKRKYGRGKRKAISVH